MSQSKVTLDSLTLLSNELRNNAESILSIKDDMDILLNSFVWDDSVAISFKERYEDGLKPITNKLIPNIENYLGYISQLGGTVEEYSGGSSIHIAGGSEIDHVMPKGSHTDPPVISSLGVNSSAPTPSIGSIDSSSITIAATGILAAIAGGAMLAGSRDFLVQKNADELFEKKYGISRTELLLSDNPKKKELIEKYNGLTKSINSEVSRLEAEVASRRLPMDVGQTFTIDGVEYEVVNISNGCGTEGVIGKTLGSAGAFMDAAWQTRVEVATHPTKVLKAGAIFPEKMQKITTACDAHDVGYYGSSGKKINDSELTKVAPITGTAVKMSGPLPYIGSDKAYADAAHERMTSDNIKRLIEERTGKEVVLAENSYLRPKK